MIEPDHTKLIIARSLISLMQKMPLDKISVARIADNCGLNRHTFYYHFIDKQDLVRWIFDYDISRHIGIPLITDIEEARRTFFIRKIIEVMYTNKSFYTNSLNSSSQNSLHEYLYKEIFAFREKQICAILDGRSIAAEAKKFLADYFTCAIYGFIIRWVENDMPYPPDVFYKGYMNVAFQSMEFLINEYIKENQ